MESYKPCIWITIIALTILRSQLVCKVASLKIYQAKANVTHFGSAGGYFLQPCVFTKQLGQASHDVEIMGSNPSTNVLDHFMACQLRPALECTFEWWVYHISQKKQVPKNPNKYGAELQSTLNKAPSFMYLIATLFIYLYH